MGSSASSSKQIIHKNADAHTKHDIVNQVMSKENADAQDHNEKQNATNSLATNVASISEPLHVKSKSHLSCPVFLHAMPNMTVIPYNILPSSNTDGLVQPSSIATSATVLFPMLDNSYSHMSNVAFHSSKSATKELRVTLDNNSSNCNTANSSSSISVIIAHESANTHYQTTNLSDISALLGVINGNKFAQKNGVCYLVSYSVGDGGKIEGVQSVNNVAKKGQVAVKCGKGFNLHGNANTSCTSNKDFSDIASASSSCNYFLREPSVLSEISDKCELETEADMCSRSFTSTVKVLDEASVVEHENHEPVISIPSDLVVKSVLVQESTIKDKEPLSSHTLLRRRSSRMLKKKEREQTLSSSHTHCHRRYCVFNDSAQYEAHITIGLLNNTGTLGAENDEVNKVSGLRILCKPTVHVNDPLIRPGKLKKVGYDHNVISSDHSVWCYIEVNSHGCKKNDEINSSTKSTSSSVKEKKIKVFISEVDTTSESDKKANNNKNNNNTENNSFAAENDHSHFCNWKDAFLAHATPTEMKTFTSHLNELERRIDCNEQRSWIEIYIVLAPGASVMVFEGVISEFFVHVKQLPFNEKVSLAKWGKYYTEDEIEAKKSDIQSMFVKELLKPKQKRKGKVNAHTLLYAFPTTPETLNITPVASCCTNTRETFNIDIPGIKMNENTNEACVTNDMSSNLKNIHQEESEKPAEHLNCNRKHNNNNNNNKNIESAVINTNCCRKPDFDEDAVEVFSTPTLNVGSNTHDKNTKSKFSPDNCINSVQSKETLDDEQDNGEKSKSNPREMWSGRSSHYLTSAKMKSLYPMKMLDNSISLSDSEGSACKAKDEHLFEEVQMEKYPPYALENIQKEQIREQIHFEHYDTERPVNCKVISPISFDEAYEGSSIMF